MQFSIRSYPKAILHVDGDSFFASCEVALNPKLKGKPVITGKERGIVSAMTYEAKARGVTRGMRFFEVKKVCPDAIILPSDYETYSIFSRRMYAIVRRYTPEVEEYSIDECFADLTGLKRSLGMTYQEMAEKIKYDLEHELGMTFSVGLGPTKVIAKIASKWNKPSGLTFIPGKEIHEYLVKLPIGKVWGIGPSTAAHMFKLGIRTALDFASRDEVWVKEKLSKPYLEIWYELRGVSVHSINSAQSKDDYQSISKTRTFTPPSSDRAFVFSQLSKNIENACIKARRHGLAAKEISFYLKTQHFSYQGLEIKLTQPVSVPNEVTKAVSLHFNKVFKPGTLYRATGITLRKLAPESHEQLDLFGKSTEIKGITQLYKAIDKVSLKYGKHSVFLGSSLVAMNDAQHKTERGDQPERRRYILKGETMRQRLAIPYLGEAR